MTRVDDRRPAPEPDVEPDENLTRDDLAAEADRAADRYERALWRDADLYPPRGGWGAL